jgi:hypothetical protein
MMREISEFLIDRETISGVQFMALLKGEALTPEAPTSKPQTPEPPNPEAQTPDAPTPEAVNPALDSEASDEVPA